MRGFLFVIFILRLKRIKETLHRYVNRIESRMYIIQDPLVGYSTHMFIKVINEQNSSKYA